MAGVLIYAIVIGVIIFKAVSKQNRNHTATTQNRPQNRPQAYAPQNFAQPPRQQNYNRQNAGQQNYVREQQYKQQQTKQRLQQKFANWTPQNAMSPNNAGYGNGVVQKAPTDILERAKANVQEEAHDVLKCISETDGNVKNSVDVKEYVVNHEQYHVTSLDAANGEGDAFSYQFGSPAAEMSETMKQVNDLMITGYNGAMEFDRDFIAEGVEMLNAFQS